MKKALKKTQSKAAVNIREQPEHSLFIKNDNNNKRGTVLDVSAHNTNEFIYTHIYMNRHVIHTCTVL